MVKKEGAPKDGKGTTDKVSNGKGTTTKAVTGKVGTVFAWLRSG